MDRNKATQLLRDTLNQNGLKEWHVRLTMDITKPFLGLCSYTDKCIILNAFHIDTHPDVEIINTIRHEVAHALCPNHGHDDVWAAKAKQLGCDNTSSCASYGLDARAINAIRSGADLEVSFDEQVVRTPRYTVKKLQDKCKECGRVAITKSEKEIKLGTKLRKITTLECGHTIIETICDASPFEELTFDGSPECNHEWNKNICVVCGAKKLFGYQIEGARAIEKANGNFAIFDEMGLGKTMQPLAYLKYHPEIRPFMWLTKSGTMFQHGKEIVRVLGDKDMPWVIQTSKDRPIKGMNCLASYDILRRLSYDVFDDFKIVITDECQAIKNPDSSRTQALRRIIKGKEIKDDSGKVIAYERKKIIPLSGTPWKNRGSEFFVVLNLLDPKMFGNYDKFKREEVDYYYEGAREKEGGLADAKNFLKRIGHIAIRRERKEVMPELPLVNRTELLCELPDYARSVYKQEEDKLIRNLINTELNERSSFEEQSEIQQSLMVMKQIIGIAKVDTTVEKAQEFLEETDRKLVIFVHHIKCMEMIFGQMSKWCSENNVAQPVRLTGGMSPEERFKVQERFNQAGCRLLIASTLAAGEGLNLQTCSDCIIHERQWNPANEEQAEGRFIRIGQTANQVNAIYVHGFDTIDQILHQLVERKRMHITDSMNKEGYINTWSENGIMTDFLKELLKKRNIDWTAQVTKRK